MLTKVLSGRFTRSTVFGAFVALTLLLMTSGSVALDARSQGTGLPDPKTDQKEDTIISSSTPNTHEQKRELKHALERLPLAAALAAILALRPRRRGTPKRTPA